MLLSALSLVVCVGISVLWVRSYFDVDVLTRTTFPGRAAMRWWVACSARGRIVLGTTQVTVVGSDFGESWRAVYPSGFRLDRAAIKDVASESIQFPENTLWQRMGFAMQREHSTGIGNFSDGIALSIPHWSVAAPFAILPTRRFVAALRRRRAKRFNRCPSCGYDLRATPDHCPECGTIPKAVEVKA